MQWILWVGVVVGAWAVLSIVGGERQRRLEAAQASARAAAAHARAAKHQAEAPYLAK
jgi:hypothetical protein